MDFARYGQLLSRRQVRNLLLVTIVAKIPHSALGLLLTLHVVQTLGLGYGAAGAVVAVLAIGYAVGAPWRGRLVDTLGLRRAFIPSIVAEAIVWSVAPHLDYAGLLAAALVGGLFTLPIFSVGRQSLAVMAAPAQRPAAFALDSIGTDLTYMLGPALAALVAVHLSTVTGITGVGLCGALAGLAFVWLNPPTRSTQSDQMSNDAQSGSGAMQRDSTESVVAAEMVAGRILGSPGSKRLHNGTNSGRSRIKVSSTGLLVVAAVAGLVFGGTEIGLVSVLGKAGQSGHIGIVFLSWSLASLLGGLIYGAMTWRIHPLVLVLLMAALTIPMAWATDSWSLSVLLIPQGLLGAPALTALSNTITELVDESRRGEALGWYGAALTAGTTIGSPLMGLMIDAAGLWTGFMGLGIAGAALSAAGLFTQIIRQRRLNPTPTANP